MTGNNNPEPKKRKNGVGRPFAKGVSGNPSGRPKLVVEFQKALMDKHYDKALKALEECLDDGDGKVRMAAVREVFDRLLGKATQPITGEDGKPLFGQSDVVVAALKKLAGE